MKQNGKKNALLESGPPFYVVIRAKRRSSRLQCKGIEPWPTPGIELAISHYELKRSTDWANPARKIWAADENANQNEDKISVLKNRAKMWGKIFSGKIVLNLGWHTEALFAECSARRSHKFSVFLSSKPRPRLQIVNLLPPVSWNFLSCYVLLGLFVSNNLSGVPVN